jgi:hypothetical protein
MCVIIAASSSGEIGGNSLGSILRLVVSIGSNLSKLEGNDNGIRSGLYILNRLLVSEDGGVGEES